MNKNKEEGIESKYRIQRIESIHNSVEMAMQEVPDVDLESLKPLATLVPKYKLEEIIDSRPVPKTDDERLVDNYLNAIKKMAPEIYDVLKPGHDGSINIGMGFPTQSVGPRSKPLTDIVVVLSPENYRNLGSPSLDDVIQITLKKAKKP